MIEEGNQKIEAILRHPSQWTTEAILPQRNSGNASVIFIIFYVPCI